MKVRFMCLVFLFLTTVGGLSTVEIPRLENPQLQKTIEAFLSADTETARAQLRNFTNEELLEIFSAYRAGKPVPEQRFLWLAEEFYQREADRVAADRLFYVFLAVVLLMTGIFIFSMLTYLAQRKLIFKKDE